MSVKIINVDASKWQNVLDLYEEILRQIGAPDWHGESINALIDSMIYGGINSVEPPYIIKFQHTEDLSSEVKQEILLLRQCIAEARHERRNNTGIDIDITLDIV